MKSARWFGIIAFAGAIGCSTPSTADVVTIDSPVSADVSADVARDSTLDATDARIFADATDVTVTDATDAPRPTDVTDVADTGPSYCTLHGGACTPGFRESFGFRVTCPSRSALNDGQPMAFNGGTNIVMMYGDGCGYGATPGGEGVPLACCYPVADAGADASTDAVPDVATDTGATVGDAGEGTECTSSSECAEGLLCCYPCGIPGCTNRCTTVAPGGSCPLLP